jgi:hypothetical protein
MHTDTFSRVAGGRSSCLIVPRQSREYHTGSNDRWNCNTDALCRPQRTTYKKAFIRELERCGSAFAINCSCSLRSRCLNIATVYLSTAARRAAYQSPRWRYTTVHMSLFRYRALLLAAFIPSGVVISQPCPKSFKQWISSSWYPPKLYEMVPSQFAQFPRKFNQRYPHNNYEKGW